jgi:hypothetical protein
VLVAAALAALAVGACRGEPKTALRLIVNLPTGAQADQLHVAAAVAGVDLVEADLPKQISGVIGAPTDFVLWLPDSLAGKEVVFALDAYYQSALVAHGDTAVTPKLGKTLRLTVDLYAAAPCPTGQLNCDGTCTDTTADRLHCGRCDVACDAGEVCRNSTCEHNPCGDGQHECSGACYPDDDVLHCGPSCTACPVPPAHGSASCVDGACQIDCDGGFVECPGVCVDLNSDPDNCGACGRDCASTQICQGSNCVNNPCGTGYHYCSTGCVSNDDVAHCGSSCTPCPAENGTATCDGVSCGIVCSSGYHECGGLCVSNASVQSCGSSCTACPDPANGSPTCDGVKCGVNCSNGYKPCGLDCIPNASSCDAGWRQLSPATSPPARSHAAMAYDSHRQRVVLFGGWNGADLDDTWEFNGATWTQRSPAAKPTARDSAAMAYHASSQKIVLFGGFDGSAQALGDTWVFDGTNWSQPVLSTTAPSARYGAAATYDSLTSAVVLFGGRNSAATPVNFNEVWLWSGTGWSQCTTLCPGTPPSARLGSGAVRDNNQLVVFGGGADWDMTSTYGDMYALGLGGWSSLGGSRPPARGWMGFAWDANVGNGVLFGGFTSQNVVIGDTWTWGSGAWAQVSPVATPTARGAPAMAYDAQREVTVLFGGSNGDIFFPSYFADTWEFVQ